MYYFLYIANDMLPSSGYFQSVICPFFNNGLCERPHCHFRHVKKETFGKSSFNTLIDESIIQNAGEDGRKSALLEMVDIAIKKAQLDVERNKAVLEASGVLSTKQFEGTTSVTYIPTPVSKYSSVPPTRSIPHVEPKVSKNSLIPQYHPTPISKLKKLQKLSEKEYDPVNNFSTPVPPVKRKKHSEYKVSEAKYIMNKESSDDDDDDYIPKKINLNENKETLNNMKKESCNFSESDDDLDITAEFSANDSDGEKEDIINETSICSSNKSDETQSKPIILDVEISSYSKLNSPEQEKSVINTKISEFSLVDKILLESKKCEEIINNSKNKIDKIISNKLINERCDKNINNNKNEKSDKNLNNKTEKNDKITNINKTETNDKNININKTEKNDKNTNNNKTEKNDKNTNINKTEKNDKNVSKNGKYEKSNKNKTEKSDKNANFNKTDNGKSHKLNKLKHKTEKDYKKSEEKKDSKSKLNKSDKPTDKSGKTKVDSSQKLSINESKCKEKTKSHLSSKTPSEINTNGKFNNKCHADDYKKNKDTINFSYKSPKKEKISNILDNDLADENKIKEKNSKKRTEEGKVSKNLGKSKNIEKAESLHKKSKQKNISKNEIIETESSNMSNAEFDLSEVAIELDSDLDEHDTYEECWKIFNEATVTDSSSEDANLNKIRHLEESKSKENEIVILGKKRIAHQGTFTRNISNLSTTRLSPGQVMHNRYSKLQEMYRNVEKNEEKKANSAFLSRITQSDIGKKRIAHVPNATLLAAAAEKQKLLNKTINVSASTSNTIATTVTKGERRIAHVPPMLKSKRPIIPAEYGSKVPCNIRQRYLENFIDECLKFCENEEEAFQLALEEEKNAYNRSLNKTVYLNVAVNTLKRLRNKRPIIDIDSKDNLESKRSKLNEANSNKVISHEFVLGGPKAIKTSFSIEKKKVIKIEENDIRGTKLYKLLKPYVMTEEQLEENGFPRSDPLNYGKAIITSSFSKKPISNNPLERICCRCQRKYRVTIKGKYAKEEECIYHWGRLWKRRIAGAFESRYSCCQGDSLSDGCCVAKGHVFESNETENLSGYVKTLTKSPPPDENYGTYALDCEMCYSTAGIELTRITVIGPDLKPVYETLVKPENEILDLNTRFSGINEGDLDGVSTTIGDVQAVLLSLFNSNTILIGHSLESDFKALKLIHSTVVDTSVVFPHKMGLPYKRALRTLMAEYLNKIIQNNVEGHDSQEDAVACMELMLWKIKEDIKKSLR